MNEFIWLSSTVILSVLGFLRADSMCEKNLAPCFNLIFFFFPNLVTLARYKWHLEGTRETGSNPIRHQVNTFLFGSTNTY